ncbi:MAG: hypothetical protein Ct9H300mP15_26680 [Gemmatimonadota bacterium]|nr:MAG: hypothetical protein Ct9H300mP15_26680 [Gemmatimonadota bacterium]
MSLRDLEKVIYYASYVVTHPGKQDIDGVAVEFQQLLDEDEYYDLRVKARDEGDEEFKAGKTARKLHGRYWGYSIHLIRKSRIEIPMAGASTGLPNGFDMKLRQRLLSTVRKRN